MTTSPVMGITEELLAVLEAEATASLGENGTGFVERVTGFSVIDLVAEVRRLRAAIAQQPAPAAPVAQEPVALPDGITISKDFFGTVHIKLGDFDFIQIQYDHRYTYNSHQEWVANRIVEAITAPPAAEHPDTVAVPRAVLAEAESIIESYAEALKASHAPGGDWEGEETAHDEYDFEAGVAAKLRALLAGGAE